MSNPLWIDCEKYFRARHPSCKRCKAGHKNPSQLKQHLAYMHYQEAAILQFGSGSDCLICKNYSVPPNANAKGLRIHLKKLHMGAHLELLIEDEKARSLLLKANSSGPWSTSKRKGPTSRKASGKSLPKRRKLKTESEQVYQSSSDSSHNENNSLYWSQDAKPKQDTGKIRDMTINDDASIVSSSEETELMNSLNEEMPEPAGNIAAPEFQIFQIEEPAGIVGQNEDEELEKVADE